MQQEAKITSKGQVTLPKAIRRALGVDTGDSIVFEADEHGVHLRPARPGSVFAAYAGIWSDGEGRTLEEINAQVRELRGRDE